MNWMLGIDLSITVKIFQKIFLLVVGSEEGFSGCLGLRALNTEDIKVVSVGQAGSAEISEIDRYLRAAEIYQIKNQKLLSVGSPHSIVGVEVGEFILASYSPIGGVWNAASSILYGVYHRLHNKYEVFDEGVVDILLMHCGEWNREYFSKNELSLLAQHVFKPEVVVS